MDIKQRKRDAKVLWWIGLLSLIVAMIIGDFKLPMSVAFTSFAIFGGICVLFSTIIVIGIRIKEEEKTSESNE